MMDRDKANELISMAMDGVKISNRKLLEAASVLGLQVIDIQLYTQKLPSMSAIESELQSPCISLDQLEEEQQQRSYRNLF